MGYLSGYLKYIHYKLVSKLALIDSNSFISENAKVNRFAKIVRSKIDDYTYIGPSTVLINTDIGKFCSIAAGCRIGMASHTSSYISTSPIFTEKINGTGTSWIDENIVNPIASHVQIGSDVWFGMNVLVPSSVTIGTGAIVACGAVVTKDVPPYAIVAGVPAKVIRYRFKDDVICKLLALKWWEKDEAWIKKNIHFFQREVQNIEMLNELK